MAFPVPTRSNGDDVITSWWNELVNAINDLYNGVVARQHETLDGKVTASAPAVSPSGDARVYYNTTDDELKLSKNGGAYRRLEPGVLQMDVSFTSTQTSSSSTTWVDTGLALSFTPERADSSIIIDAHVLGIQGPVGDDLGLRLMRDAVVLKQFVVSQPQTGDRHGVSYVHKESSPGTSAVTYKVQMRRVSGASSVFTQHNGDFTSSLRVTEVR